MEMDRKAQAGLEYLVTYGWAIVLVAAVIGTLVLIVGRPLDEGAFSSSDPTKLMIKTTGVEGSVATIKLQNITGGEIEVQSISSTGYYNCLASNTSDTVMAGGELEILCTVPEDIAQGEVAVQYMDSSGLIQNTLISGGGGIAIAAAPPTGENTDYLCSDSFDNDGDASIDCLDPDCVGKTGTGQYPDGLLCEQPEASCSDGFDNDGDDFIDTSDSDCEEICDVIGDEDGDGLFDCDDPDCDESPTCVTVCEDGSCNLVEAGQYTIIYAISERKTADFGGRAGIDSWASARVPSNLSRFTPTNIHGFVSVTSSDEIRDMPTRYGYDADAPIYWWHDNQKTLYKLANNWADMLDGSILINQRDGTGTTYTFVWSGSNSAGALKSGTSRNCGNWTYRNFNQNVSGQYGINSSTGSTWLDYSNACCCSPETIRVISQLTFS